MKKPRAGNTQGSNYTFYPIRTPNFEVEPTKMPSEIFAILCQLAMGPSVQAIEIIRHVDASFYLKKSRWD